MPQPLSPFEKSNPIPEKLHCARCGDVIGVYEPMIVLLDGKPHKTSAFAQQAKEPRTGACYHANCYPR